MAVGDVASFGDLPATASLSNPKETPRADPHAGCCGGRGRETPGYPIRPHFYSSDEDLYGAAHWLECCLIIDHWSLDVANLNKPMNYKCSSLFLSPACNLHEDFEQLLGNSLPIVFLHYSSTFRNTGRQSFGVDSLNLQLQTLVVPISFKIFVWPNAPMSGAGARSAEASAPLAG